MVSLRACGAGPTPVFGADGLGGGDQAALDLGHDRDPGTHRRDLSVRSTRSDSTDPSRDFGWRCSGRPGRIRRLVGIQGVRFAVRPSPPAGSAA